MGESKFFIKEDDWKKFEKINVTTALNPHMRKLGPRGPTHYIFGD